jgi:hypothetical protein
MGALFPLLQKIACLLKNQAVVTTRYLEATKNKSFKEIVLCEK